MSLSPISIPGSTDSSPADEPSASAAPDATDCSPPDEQPNPDEPSTEVGSTDDMSDKNTSHSCLTVSIVLCVTSLRSLLHVAVYRRLKQYALFSRSLLITYRIPQNIAQ